MRLSTTMRAALVAASQHPLLRTHDQGEAKPPWPSHPSTLQALVRHGLLDHQRRRNRKGYWFDEWALSTAGKQALQPVHRTVDHDRPVYLARMGRNHGDYTHNRARAIDDLETHSGSLDPEWVVVSSRKHREAEDARVVARRLARQAKAA